MPETISDSRQDSTYEKGHDVGTGPIPEDGTKGFEIYVT
jgi:hypothetical protein